ncbi:PotD/PotF family extracellular solute-binding protein [Streptomyces shenzhenensis]|uniref:ABC transporter substrate-binding protein n=1 Tax=Streptomyces shenzhenensis TaxID=943815 RepID=UPI0011C47EEB|nr:extracellular solute-binding protein [Streptomyces shenzhenensis]
MKSTPSFRTRRQRDRRARSVAAVAAIAAGALTLSACSLGAGSAGSSGGKTLTVGIWKGYGADLSWVATQFKQETGASLKFVYIDSERNLLDLMKKADGGIDVGLPNIQYIGDGIDGELFHELDTSELTNFGHIYPQFADRKELRKDGKLYGIPWTYGSTGLFYDDRVFKTAPTSLSVLWDSKYKGKIAVNDNATVEIPTAALYKGEDPQHPGLGTIEPALKDLKANAKLLYSSTDDLAKALSSGTVVAGIGNNDAIGGLIGSGQTHLKYTVPEEGAVGWIDNWAISAKTKNLGLAYDWLNYMTGSKFLTKWADTPEDASPAPANQKVVESLDSSVTSRLQADPAKISSLALQLPMPTARMQSWEDLWQKVKAG